MITSIIDSRIKSTLSSIILSGTATPFDFDLNTLFFNFTSAENTVDNNATPTMVSALDLIGRANFFYQATKDSQPLKVANGLNFNQDTNRVMILNSNAGITNNKTGWYCAFNIRPTTTDFEILNISRNAGNAVSSRGSIQYTASGNLVVRASSTSEAASVILYGGAAIAVGNAFTCQVQMDSAGGTSPLTIWTNVVGGVNELQRTLVSAPGVAFPAFPATDPAQITFGNSQLGGQSLDGVITDLVFYNGIPTTQIRNSIASYLFSRRVLL